MIELKLAAFISEWLNDMGLEIRPSKDSQKRHYRQLTEVIDKSRGINQALLIYLAPNF